MDQSVVDSDQSFASDEDIVGSNVEFVNALFAEHLRIHEIAPNALRSYYVDYYLTQVFNGGFAQFVYNSGWSPTLLNLVQEGLAAMKAVQHLRLFDAGAAIVDRLGPERLQAFLQSEFFGQKQNAERDILNANDDRFVKLSKTEDLKALNAAWLRSLPCLQVKTIDEIQAEVEHCAAALPDREQRLQAALEREPRYMRLVRALSLKAGHKFSHMNGYDDRRQHDGKTVLVWLFTTDKGDYYMVESEGRAAMFADGFAALFERKPVAQLSAVEMVEFPLILSTDDVYTDDL